MTKTMPQGWYSPRTWFALAIFIAGCLLIGPLEADVYHLLATMLGIQPSAPNVLEQASYGLRMCVRLSCDAGLWIAVARALEISPLGFPLSDQRYGRHLGIGLATGLVVMLATMCSIWAITAAHVSWSGQTPAAALKNGASWFALDVLGALGEELFGRAILVVLAQRLFGWRLAILISGLVFAGGHIFNPGSDWVWLLRLLLQGALLAYAVLRTGSLWWSLAYHTGWNWVSAPVFGAAGSGYVDEGHILDFEATGSVWITGGPVGPEGSIFAFLAVLAALALLVVTTRRQSVDGAVTVSDKIA